LVGISVVYVREWRGKGEGRDEEWRRETEAEKGKKKKY
jgi:hypothetical protein